MINANNILIIVAGPTAVGKTQLAIELAQHFSCSILSADSRQLYKELTIGTAKASKAQLDLVPHHFINHISIQSDYSVGTYEKEAIHLLHQLFSKKSIQILCGGSGLFINAIRNGLDDFPKVEPSVLAQLNETYQTEGIESLQKMLLQKDPTYYRQVDLMNSRRLLRALSVIEQTGKTFSSFWTHKNKTRDFFTIPILLNEDRSLLYQRIDDRVDEMISDGLEEEAKSLLPFREKKALQTVGYQEWFDFFDGTIDREEAIRLIKRNSRRYAKRQGTWFRRDGDWHEFYPNKRNTIIPFIQQKIKELQSA